MSGMAAVTSVPYGTSSNSAAATQALTRTQPLYRSSPSPSATLANTQQLRLTGQKNAGATGNGARRQTSQGVAGGVKRTHSATSSSAAAPRSSPTASPTRSSSMSLSGTTKMSPAAAVRARAMAEVRLLEKQHRASVAYPLTAQPLSALTNPVSHRPHSAGTRLPPLEGSVNTDTQTTPSFNRTQPLSSPSSTPSAQPSSSSSFSPLAGVDDARLHARVFVDSLISNRSFIYRSERLARFVESRREKHVEARRQFDEWKAEFDRELSGQVERLCLTLREQCAHIEKPLKHLLHKTMADERILRRMDADSLQQARNTFDDTYASISTTIDQTLRTLNELEDRRASEVAKSMEQLLKAWLDIGAEDPAECERILAEDTHQLNVHILRNRATYTELDAALKSELVLKSRAINEKTWTQRFEQWKALRHAYYLKRFQKRFLWNDAEPDPLERNRTELERQRMRALGIIPTRKKMLLPGHESEGRKQQVEENGEEEDEDPEDRIIDDPDAAERPYPFQYSRVQRKNFDQLMRIQQSFQEEVSEVIRSILSLTPKDEPDHVGEMVEPLVRRLQDAYAAYDVRADEVLARIQQYELHLQQRAQQMVDELRRDLTERNEGGAFDQTEIEKQLNQQIMPLLHSRMDREKKVLNRVRRVLKHFDKELLKSLDHFSTFYEGSTKIWHHFRKEVQKTHGSYTEKIAQERDNFDDRLRHIETQLAEHCQLLESEPTCESLDQRLEEVRSLLAADSGAAGGGTVVAGSDSPSLSTAGALEECYRAFHRSSTALTEEYPMALQQVVSSCIQRMAKHWALLSPEEVEAQQELLRQQHEAAQTEAMRKEEAEEAKLPKKDRMKKQQEKERLKLQKDRESEEADHASGQAARKSRSRGTSAKASRKKGAAAAAAVEVDEEALKQQAFEKAKNELSTILQSGHYQFYSLPQFESRLIESQTLVRLVKVPNPDEVGMVDVQPGEIMMDAEERNVIAQKEGEQTQTMEEEKKEDAMSRMNVEDLAKHIVVQPASTLEDSRPTTARSSSSLCTSPPAPTLPPLSLPSSVLQFQQAMPDHVLIERIVHGEKAAAAALANAGLGDGASLAAVGALSSTTDTGSPLDSARSGSAPLQLSLLSASEAEVLKTSDESEEDEQAAQLAAALEAATISAQEAQAQAERAATPPHASSKSKSKSKAAREKEKEEELARQRAEEEARAKAAEEQARLEAALAELTSIPYDLHGLPLLYPLEFPMSLLRSKLYSTRESFLMMVALDGWREVRRCEDQQRGVRMDLLSELNMNLRRHRPRFNRVMVDIFEARAAALAAHMQAYNRLVGRLRESKDAAEQKWNAILTKGAASLIKFQLSVVRTTKKLETLSRDPYASLATLQGFNTTLKSALRSLLKEFDADVAGCLRRAHADFLLGVRNQIDLFVGSCRRQMVGSHETGLTQIEQVGEDGETVASWSRGGTSHGMRSGLTSSAGRNMAGPIIRVVECFHPEEIAHYTSLLSNLSGACESLVAAHSDKLSDLEQRVRHEAELTEWKKTYDTELANIQVQQGLGHQNGAPKRALTLALRSEFHRNEIQERYIDALLRTLQQAVDRTDSNETGRSSPTKEDDEEQKQPLSRTSSSASASASASFSDLTDTEVGSAFFDVTPPLFVPTSAARSRCVSNTSFLLRTIHSLRRALAIRAQYLEAVSPESAVAKSSALSESLENEEEIQQIVANPSEEGMQRRMMQQQIAVAAANEAQKQEQVNESVGRTGARGGSRKAAGTNASSSAVSPLSPKSGKHGAIDASATSVSASSTPRSSTATPFLSLIGEHIRQCKKATSQLVAAYDAKFPQRRQAREAEEKEQQAAAAAAQGSAMESKEEDDEKRTSGGSSSSSRKKKDRSTRGKGKNDAAAQAAAAAESAAAAAAAATADPVPLPIGQHCDAEQARCQAHLKNSLRGFLLHTDRAVSLLASSVGPLLEDIFNRLADSELNGALHAAERSFTKQLVRWQRKQTRHSSELTPAIASRPDAALAELCAAEDERFHACIQGIQAFRRKALESLGANSKAFVGEMDRVIDVTLKMMDATLLPIDLVNARMDGMELVASQPSLNYWMHEMERRAESEKEVAAAWDAVAAAEKEAEQAGVIAAEEAKSSGGNKRRSGGGSGGGGGSKKSAAPTPAQIEAERLVAEARAHASALEQRPDPRFRSTSWEGLAVDVFHQPESSEEAEERKRREEEAEAAEKKRQEEAEAAAAAAAAVESGRGGRKKPPKRSTTRLAPTSDSGDDTASTDRSGGGTRRGKKLTKAEEEALAKEAAESAAKAEAEAAAAQAAMYTQPFTALDQPPQRSLLQTRDQLFQRYTHTYQQHLTKIVDTCEQRTAAEKKARKEWLAQVERLTNPQPIQFNF